MRRFLFGQMKKFGQAGHHGRKPDIQALGFGSLAVVLVVIGFFATAHFFPHSAIAFVSKNTSCSASTCHGTTISGATLTTGINGSQTTSVTATAGSTFEVDWIFTNVANGDPVGVEVVVPTGWTVARGTANTTGLTGWSTAWNLSDGVSAWTGGYDTSAEYPNSQVGYSLDYNGTGWDAGSRNSAFDDGSSGDLDGTAERMGCDVRITVPAGTPGGTYQVVVLGIGHDSSKAKGHIEQVITVTVPSAGTLQFSSPTYSVAENGSTATITVTRTGGSTGAASVQYATSNGTATSGSDYTTASGTLNWTAGDAASKTFTVPITNDTVYEGNETVNLTLSNATGATLGSQTTATLTITDNETPPTVQFNTTSGSGAESVTPVTLTVTLSGTTSAVPVTVPFSVNASSTATGSGTDYTISASPLTFTPGVTSQNITLTIVDDTTVEPNETVIVNLGSPTNANLGTNTQYTYTINNNDAGSPGTIALSTSAYSIGEAGPSVTITATRTGGSSGAVGISYATSSGTATSGSDFTATSGALSWSDGDTASKTFEVPITNDTAVEGNEDFTVTLSSPTGGASLGSPASATVTIIDNDSYGTISLSASAYSIGEAGPTVTITATRTGGSSGAVGISYATSSGTATSGSDFTATSGSLSWANGDTASKTFDVPITNDAAVEGNEDFTVTLSSPTGGASLGSPASATVTVVDNDVAVPGTIALSTSAYSIGEAGPSVTITATRTGGSSGVVGISYGTSNGTALAGSDYTTASGTLSWADGDTASKTFTVAIIDDSDVDPNETFTVALSSPTGGASLGSPASATVTIVDNDGAPASTSPLMHNSANTSITYGTWGTDKNCNWCHAKGSANVKRIAQTIDTPYGTQQVVFTRMTASQSSISGVFGDDQRSYALTASTNVCEVCHHKTKYHRYSSNSTYSGTTFVKTHENRSDCMTCHSHKNGFMASCDSCHGNPPNSSIAGGPNGMAKDGSNITGFANPGAHVIHSGDPLLGNQGMKCSVCHSGNSTPHPSQTVQLGFVVNNSTWNAKFVGSNSASYGSYSGTSLSAPFTYASSDSGTIVRTAGGARNSCNVYCHGGWANANGTTNPTWTGGSADATCGTCHGASSSRPPLTGSHVQHASNTTGNYGFSCSKCHTVVTGAGDGHVNGSVQWRLSTGSNLVGISGFTPQYRTGASGSTGTVAPSSSFGNCTNIYCHSAGQGSTGGAITSTEIASVQWGNTSVGCGSCHKNMASDATAPGDHVRHSQNYGYSCGTCHKGYSATSVTVANHVNRTIYLNFSGQAAGTTYGKTSPFATSLGYSSCSNSYCHSTGQSNDAKAAIKRTVTWGSALDCGGCHNNMATFGNASSGSHKIHSQTAAYSCDLCHGATYGNATVPRQANSTHVNRKINLAWTGKATGIVYSKYSASGFAPAKGYYGTCSTSVCHGGAAAKITWGNDTTRPECMKCHGSNAASFTNISAAAIAPGYNSEGHDLAGNTAATAARVGAHQGHLTAATGISDTVHCGECHVKVSNVSDLTHLDYTTATVNMLSGRGSLQSHTPTVSRTSGVISCSNTYCHTGKTNTGNAMTPAFNNMAYLNSTMDMASCKQCHNMPPNPGAVGDHSTVPAALTSFPVNNSCNCHSNLSTTATTYAAIFTDKKKHVDGVVDVDGGHVTPYYAGYTYNEGHQGCLTGVGCHQNTNPAATYPAASGAPDCRSCHKKADPTVTATCASCHGSGINNAAAPTGTTAPDRAGSHAKHMALASATCTGCHDTGGAGGMANHGPGNHGANAAVINVASAQAWSSGAHTCSTSYCHSSAQSKNGTNTGIHYSTTPSWLSPTTLNCGGCHANMATFNNISSGDHQRHSKEYAFQCYYCHGTGYKAVSVTDGAINTHVNGQINMAFAPLSSSLPAYGTTYSKTSPFNPGLGFGSCSNSYCHSNGQSNDAKAAIKRIVTWNTTLDCGGCHNNMATFANASSGSHKAHSQTSAYTCDLCHGASYGNATVPRTSGSTHVNKKINLAWTGKASGIVYSKYSASGFAPAKGYYGTCATSVCHGGALAKKTWGADTTRPQCMKCHGSTTASFTNTSAATLAPGYNAEGKDLAGNTNATTARVGTHDAHLRAVDTISDTVHCGECHVAVTSVAATAHLNYTTATVTLAGRARANGATPAISRSGGVITCSNTYCHGAKMWGGDATGANKSPAFNATTYLPATLTTAACTPCHGFPPSTASGHPTATAPSSFPTSNCNCHSNLSTTSSSYATIFNDKKLHINGIYEAAASGCKGCHAAGSAKDVQTEFAKNSHHTNKAWANITDADCVVCHAEGSIAAGSVSVVVNRHGNDTGTKGVVDLYNADNRATIYSLTLTDLTGRVAAANSSLDTFCMSCHDSNGASAVTSGNGFTVGSATNPFNDTTLTNSYDQQTRTFGAAPAPLNVYDAFATTNYSHHAVRGARYTKTTGLTFGVSLTGANLLSTSVANYSGGTGVTDMSTMHCNDCHSTAYSSHGGANEYMLQTATNENPTAEHTGPTDYVCIKCHVNGSYNGGTGTHVGNASDYAHTSASTGTARASSNGHITGIACLNCHDGAVGFGGIHGVPNATYTAGEAGSGGGTYNKRRFMPGSGLRYYDPSLTHTSTTINDDGTWGEATATNQCYTLSTANTTSACTKHNRGTGANMRNTRRPVTY